MNPLTYLMQRYQARKRKQLALRMLMFSGAIRRADRGIRYAMTPKELKKLLHHTKEKYLETETTSPNCSKLNT